MEASGDVSSAVCHEGWVRIAVVMVMRFGRHDLVGKGASPLNL